MRFTSLKTAGVLAAVLLALPFFLDWRRGAGERALAPSSQKVASSSLEASTTSIAREVPVAGIFIVNRVVDGDTIALETGEKVRYIGINSPESVDPRRSVQCFGREASAYNKKLVEGKAVKLVKDISETDRYGRLLRYVYLEDGTFINLKLVQEGFAHAATFPPDVAQAEEFVAAERAARLAGKGLWNACKN
mgnify:CR=1 FL=1